MVSHIELHCTGHPRHLRYTSISTETLSPDYCAYTGETTKILLLSTNKFMIISV